MRHYKKFLKIALLMRKKTCTLKKKFLNFFIITKISLYATRGNCGGLPYRILVPLKYATQKAYDELRNTVFGRFVNEFNGVNPFEYYCNALTEKEMFGIIAPSTKLDIIDNTDKVKGVFKDYGDRYEGIGLHDINVGDIKIEKKVLDSYIKKCKSIKSIGFLNAYIN